MFKEIKIQWNDDKIPLKEMGLVHDREFCDMLHSMYTNNPLLQEVEERQEKMMDCNYLILHIDRHVIDGWSCPSNFATPSVIFSFIDSLD